MGGGGSKDKAAPPPKAVKAPDSPQRPSTAEKDGQDEEDDPFGLNPVNTQSSEQSLNNSELTRPIPSHNPPYPAPSDTVKQARPAKKKVSHHHHYHHHYYYRYHRSHHHHHHHHHHHYRQVAEDEDLDTMAERMLEETDDLRHEKPLKLNVERASAAGGSDGGNGYMQKSNRSLGASPSGAQFNNLAKTPPHLKDDYKPQQRQAKQKPQPRMLKAPEKKGPQLSQAQAP
jgi:hypothetical protein